MNKIFFNFIKPKETISIYLANTSFKDSHKYHYVPI